MSARILIAEDDAAIREAVQLLLKSEGFQCTAVCDGFEALEALQKETFDLLLLDIMMPRCSGYELCKQLRGHGVSIPILFISARTEENDRVLGLELGADDYITKPFSLRELLARVSAVLRRTQKTAADSSGTSFLFGSDRIFPVRLHLVSETGRTFELSERECRLLTLFANHPGEVLSRDTLLNQCWGLEYFGSTRTVDQHIAILRKKLSNPELLQTIHGIGYRYGRFAEQSPS